MAIYHFSVKIIKRSEGRSAVAAAAYRSGTKLTNEWDGITHDYTKKHWIEHSEIFLPAQAKKCLRERSTLWNSVESIEKSGNAQLAREFEVALPIELSEEERYHLVQEFIQKNLVERGMCVDLAIHNPPLTNSFHVPVDKDGNPTTDKEAMIFQNPHAHIMTTMRPLDADGNWMDKYEKSYLCRKDNEELATNAQKAVAAAQAAPAIDADAVGASGASGTADTSAVSSAQRNLASAQATLDQANAKAAERTVTAPSSGSIVELNAKVGATVTGGMIMGEGDTSGGKQCMQIADLSKMKVTVQVGEKDIAKIAVGQSANVTYPAFPDIVSQGTVTSIASVANSDAANGGGGSVTFNVDILIEAPDARLKPGMTAEVSVVTEQLNDVVMVPTMALMTEDGEHYYVNVATDGEGKQTRRVKVTVLTQNDNDAVVGKTQVKRDDQGNEINPNVPVTKLRDGDTLIMDTGADMTADGGDTGSMSADEGM